MDRKVWVNSKTFLIVVAIGLMTTVPLIAAEGTKAPASQTSKRPEPDRDPWASVWVSDSKKKLPTGVTHHVYHSECMNRDVGYCVYLPPQYDQEPARRFPVIYELHGNGGNETANNATAQLLHKTILAGKCPPFIMVMPNGGLATMYNDSIDGKLMPDTAITQELIPLIDKTYRTIASREGRGIEGFSMGGHGAVKLAFKYPDLFGSMIAWAGGMQHIADRVHDTGNAKVDARNRAYYGNDPANYEANDPFFLVRKNADQIRGKMKIMLVCGTADTFHLKGTREMDQLLTELKIDHEYHEVPGIEHQQVQLREPFGERCFDTHVRS